VPDRTLLMVREKYPIDSLYGAGSGMAHRIATVARWYVACWSA
jgi:hypothetical protein